MCKFKKVSVSYFMDSRTVCLCSAAFRRICSRIISAFSLSTRARALVSASMRSISFLCLRSISCSIVAVEITTQVLKPRLIFKTFHKSTSVKSGEDHTFPHGLLFVYRLLLFTKVLLIQGLLLKNNNDFLEIANAAYL